MGKNASPDSTVNRSNPGFWDISVGGMIIAIGIATGVWGLNVSDTIALPGVLVCLLVGSILGWAGILQLVTRQPAYEPCPPVPSEESGGFSFHPQEIQPGIPFLFTYRQSVGQATRIDGINVFLIYRETVSLPTSDGRETKTFDRLFQQLHLPSSLLREGDTLHVEATFQMPRGAIGERNCFLKRLCDWHSFVAYGRPETESTQWLIKLEIRFTHQKDYLLFVPVEPVLPQGIMPDKAERADGFDIFLGRKQENEGDIMAAIAPFLPHLEAAQLHDLIWARPCLLRERLTWGQANEMKAQLEAVGAEVVLLPAHLLSAYPDRE